MDIGIPVEIVTPRGTLYFNGYDADPVNGFPSTPYLRLSAFDGIDFPNLGTSIQPRAQFDGDILYDSFRRGRYPSLVGQVVGRDMEERAALSRSLRDKLNSIVRADGTLRWTQPSDLTEIALAGITAPSQHYRLGGTTEAEAVRDIGVSNSGDGSFSGAFTYGVAPVIQGTRDRAVQNTVLNRQFASPSNITDTNGNQSIIFWVNAAAGQAAFSTLIAKTAGGTGWQIQRRSADEGVQVRFDTSGGANQVPVTTNVPVLDGLPHMVGLVIATGAAYLYVDGVKVSEGGYTHGTGFQNNTTPLRISATSGSNQILGVWDELMRWHNTALSHLQVAQIYRMGTPRRQMTVRMWEPLQISGSGVIKDFRIGLVSPDAYAVAENANTIIDTTASPWQVVISHAGNGEARPVFRVTGSATPVTAFSISDGTNVIAAVTGISLGAGQWIEVDLQNRTVKDQAGANQIAKLTISTSTFTPVPPMATTTYTMTPTGTPSEFRAVYRDTFVA